MGTFSVVSDGSFCLQDAVSSTTHGKGITITVTKTDRSRKGTVPFVFPRKFEGYAHNILRMTESMKRHISLSIALTLCLFIVGCANSNPIISGLPEDEASLPEQLPARAQDETPVQEPDEAVLEYSYISTLSVSGCNVFVVDTDGKLWGWGQNIDNVLQIEAEESLYPVEVFDSVKSISAGGGFVLAIREDDTLWGWGRNQNGQLGLGTNTETEYAPVKIMEDVAAVSAGSSFSVALKKDGALLVAGDNAFGVLGNRRNTYEFIKVMDNIQSFHAGYSNIVAIDRNYCLWAWGNNQFGPAVGKCGRITNEPEQSVIYAPCKLMEDVCFARASFSCLYMLKLDGGLIEWQSPTELRTLLDNTVYVDASDWTIAAITSDGSLFCWGLSYTNQDNDYYILAGDVVYTAVSDQFVSYIDDQNDLYCAGLNFYGLVGNGENAGPTGPPIPDGGYRKTVDDYVYPPVKVLSNVAY